MKKSLTINATRNGKKVSKNFGYVNPDVANSIAGGFAQMVNALTTNTFVNAEVVKKMDTTEEEQQSGGGGKLNVDLSNAPTSIAILRSFETEDIENGVRINVLHAVSPEDVNIAGYIDVTVA